MSLQTVEQLREENRVLKNELERLEELLVVSRSERDQIGIRYNAISERLEAVLKKERGDVSSDDVGRQSLVQQNIELRRKLEEEHSNYKQKLQFYQDGQARQAQLVQKLQAKVLQYKNRCSELEEQLRQSLSGTDRGPRKTIIKLSSTRENFETESSDSRTHRDEMQFGSLDQLLDSKTLDLDSAVIQLEGEQSRVEHLNHVNGLLREQLDKATSANQSLMADLHRLAHIEEELQTKEAEWQKEEQSFHDYYAHTHSHLIDLWRTICAFRRDFNEMKLASEHELSHLASEFYNDTQEITAQLRNSKTQSQTSLDKERSGRLTLEGQLAEKVRQLNEIQAKFDAKLKDFTAKNNELSTQNERLRLQLTTEHSERLTHKDEEEVRRTSRQQQQQPASSRTDRSSYTAVFETLRHIAKDLLDNCDYVDSTIMRENDAARLRSNQSTKDRGGSIDLSSSSVHHIRSVSHSPLRARSSRSPSPSPNSEETMSLVRTALQRSRQQIIDLTSRLTSHQTENQSLRNQCRDVDSERQRLEGLLRSGQDERDRLHLDSKRQLDQMKLLLDSVNVEKERLDDNRQKLLEKIDVLGIEIQRLKSANAELQKNRDDLNIDKEELKRNAERQDKEIERFRRLVEQSEEKLGRLKEELVVTKEALNAAQLRKDMIEREKNEIDGALSRAERRRDELEAELSKAKAEALSLRETVTRNQITCDALNREKMELTHNLSQVESEKKSLASKIAGLEQEVSGLRAELVAVEREKVDLEHQKSAMAERLRLAEKGQKDFDEENRRLNAERNELVQKVNAESRQKKTFIEEIRVSRQEIERLLSTCNRSNSEKEELARDRAELLTKNDSQEKIIQQQNEVMVEAKMEKDNLEAELYQLDQLNSQLEKKTAMLEVENKELLDKREQLQSALSKLKRELESSLEKLESQRNLLQQQLLDRDRESEERLRKERTQHEERLQQLIKEWDEKSVDHQKEVERLKQQFIVERKELTSDYEDQINQLNEEIESIQRDYDKQLIIIANDKQQTLAELEQERNHLHEKLLLIEKELKDAQLKNENQKREWQHQKEQLMDSVSSLQMETKDLRIQIDDSRLRHEVDLKKLNALISDLKNQLRDDELALNEISELREQLKLAEETRDNLKHELIEVSRKLREANEANELSQSEIANLKRAVEQETFEKDAALKSSTEFRNMVKKAEGEKLEQNRIIQELKQKISVLEEQIAGAQKETEELRGRVRESEKAHIESRRAQQELSHQIQQLESERARLTQEMSDMHGCLVRSKGKEEEQRKENLSLKQQVLEADGSRDAILKELAMVGRRKTQLEEDFRLRENEFQRVLEESRTSERNSDDQRRRAEKSLEAANSKEAELRLRLSEAEGKIRGMEEHQAWVEDGKRRAEEKLNNIVSCLQRTIGFSAVGVPRSRSTVRVLRGRSPSPRRGSTTGASFSLQSHQQRRSVSSTRSRSVSPPAASYADISVDVIRSALQDFVKRLTQTEQDKDKSATSLRSLVSKLKEMEEEYRRSTQKVQQLQKSLNETEEVRRDFESRLTTERASLTAAHEEAVRRHSNERKQLEDELRRLQQQATANEQNNQLIQELTEKLKNVETRAESEKRALRLSLEELEGHAAKFELVRGALDGEVQRLKRIVSERETEMRSMIGETEKQTRVIHDLEQKLQSVDATNNDLNRIVAEMQTELELHRNELHSLKSLMQERMAAIVSLQDHQLHLQRTLDASEQDRRVLQERLENNRHSLNEMKKENNSYVEKIHDLENRLSNSEHQKTEAEGNSKLSLLVVKKKEELEEEFVEKIQKLQAEKFHLQELINVHQRNSANIEIEKQTAERSAGALEKENAALIMTLEKVDSSEKRNTLHGKSQLCDACLNLDRRLRMMDEDNAELNRQLQTLQAQFDQAEHDYEQKLTEIKVLHSREKELAIEQMRSHWQKTIDDQDRNNRQRIRSLDKQIETLRRELELEIRKRQQYISHGLTPTLDEERRILLPSGQNVQRSFSTDFDPILFDRELKMSDGRNRSSTATVSRRSPVLRASSPVTSTLLSPSKSSTQVTRSTSLHRVSVPVPLRRK